MTCFKIFNNQIFYVRKFLTALLFILLVLGVDAQNVFLEPSLVTYDELESSEKLIYDQILETSNTFVQHSIVEFGNFYNDIITGKLVLNLPLSNCENSTFHTDRIDFKNNSNYFWSGSVKIGSETGCQSGYANIVSRNDQIYGSIQLGEKSFQLIDLGNDKGLLSELVVNQGIVDCISGNNGSESSIENPYITSYSYCTIDVLVLFDPTLTYNGSVNLQNLEDFELEMDLHWGILNAIRDNSGMPYVRFNLLGVEPLPSGANVQPSVDGIAYAANLANDDEVGDLKINRSADVIAMFVPEGSMMSGTSPLTGVVHQNTPLVSEDAYMLFEPGSVSLTRFTFAHEIAHLVGAGHDVTANNTPPQTTQYSHGLVDINNDAAMNRSVVARATDNDDRVMHYSNPDIDFNGDPTGKIKTNDNARRMEELVCMVSNFEDPFELLPPTFRLDAPSNACVCQTVNVTFDGDASSASYNWLTSTNGIDFNPVVGQSGSQINVTMPCGAGERIWIRLEYTDLSTGFSETYNISIVARLYDELGRPCGLKLENAVGIESSPFALKPNPVITNLIIESMDSDVQIKDYFVYNSLGMQMKLDGRSRFDSSNKINFSVENYIIGTYYVKIITTGNDIYWQKFVKI